MDKDTKELDLEPEHMSIKGEIEMKEEIKCCEGNLSEGDSFNNANISQELQSFDIKGEILDDVTVKEESLDLYDYEKENGGEKPKDIGNCSFKQDNAIIYKETGIIMPSTSGINSEMKVEKSDEELPWKRKSNLEVHSLKQSGAKLFKCSHCSYETNQKCNLKCHLLNLHSDIKLFKCSQCHYETNRKSTLEVHELNHSGAKLLKCSHCSYETNWKGGLKVHILNHSVGCCSMASGANEYSSDKDDIPTNIQEPMLKRRGAKTGTKRGKYSKTDTTGEAKKRVIVAAENDADWKAVAEANGIAISTAYGWIRRADEPAKKRGGFRQAKVHQEQIDKMIQYVQENPVITLKEIAARLANETGITVSTNTVHKYLDGQLYTMKKVLPEPVSVNSEANKQKRKEYVEKLMNRIGRGKTIVYIDETNANLFLRRSQGRARKGVRCMVKSPTSKGKNIHILGGISQHGIVYWERRRGSYKKEDCHEWLRRMLRTITEPLDNIVVVCDNAPVHAGLESVVEEEEFYGVEILRVSPYSAPLNPIEECWSVMKAAMKRVAANFATMMNTPPVGMTQTEYRMQYLERCIHNAISTITPMLCLKTCNHVQKHFAGVMQLQDLQLGDN